MAHPHAPAARPHVDHSTVLGLLVLTAMLLLTVYVVWSVVGAPSRAEPAATRESAVYPAEAQPTPYWRFRDEWLTPRPRG